VVFRLLGQPFSLPPRGPASHRLPLDGAGLPELAAPDPSYPAACADFPPSAPTGGAVRPPRRPVAFLDGRITVEVPRGLPIARLRLAVQE